MSQDSTTTLETTHGHAHEEDHHGPKSPVKTYALTLVTLLILTIITVAVAQFDLGEANVFAAICDRHG